MQKIYDINGVTEYLGISKVTFYRLVKAKSLQAFKIGREWRVEEAELIKYVNKAKKCSG